MSADFVFKADVAASEPQDDTRYPFVGVASSTSLDRQGERITEKCLAGMAEQVPMVLAVAPSHNEAIVDVMAEAGTITAFKAEDGDLHIAGNLDPKHPNAEFLWGKMQEGNSKLSIAGRVLEARKSVWDGDLGKHVGEIDAIELDHILLCRSAAAVNQGTSIVAQTGDWADAIFKAAADVAKVELPDDVSHEALRDLIYEALEEAHNGYGWVVEVFENTVIVEVAGVYYRHDYTYEDGKVVLGDGTEVKLDWVAAAIAEHIVDTPSTKFVTQVGSTLSAVSKVTTDRTLRTRAWGVFVEDLLKADALSGNPDGEGKIMDAMDKLCATLETLVNGAKASAPAEEPSATPETTEEPEAEKSDPMLEVLQQVAETMKAIEARVTALETPPVEEPVTEKAEEVPVAAEEEEAAEEEPAAEEEAAPEPAPEAEEVGKVAEALGTIVSAIKELQAEVQEMKTDTGKQEQRLSVIEKASPVSAQVTTPNTNPSETVAGGSPTPIHDMLMGQYRGA